MARDIKALVAQMTTEEKAGLCGGKDFWHTRGLERLGIPSVMVTDGPHGLRKQKESSDHLGIGDSVEAVCFPAACAFTASFDRTLAEALGAALGDVCQAEDVSIILGPAINIKRSPLCGRNFEYMSEDPYLTGKMAAAYIRGVQGKNVGTSLKHYAANNQEFGRSTVSSEIDERTLREIYLPGFETAVKEAQPWTLMCSYNKLNGLHAAENPKLLTEILRDEWGFSGYVMSDWFAVSDRVPGLKAGLDLEMPYSGGHNDQALLAAVQSGEIPPEVLDRAAERILTKVFAYADNRKPAEHDRGKCHALALSIEKESAVLLKNEGGPDKGILPLKKGAAVAFIGGFAEKPRYQGGGSSHINAHRVVSALEAAKDIPGWTYTQGFPIDGGAADPAAISAAVEAAKKASAAVIFAGLSDAIESEGYDRTNMALPEGQNALIAAVAAVQPNTVVVLHNGSPVEMPWAGQVKAILELYLGGEAAGEAAVSILFGDTNPSGKLAETFPLHLEDNPSYGSFPGDGKRVFYREGIYVGYRHYDHRKMEVLFPFGHGLSYTSFSYRNLKLDKKTLKDTETLKVSVDITNTGKVPGKEVVQLYVGDKTRAADRPLRELKGFEKVSLAPGETKTVSFTLDKRSFAWYNTDIKDWYAASGDYEISVAASSRDIRLQETVALVSTTLLPFRVDTDTTIGALLKDSRTRDFVQREIIAKAMQRQAPGGIDMSSLGMDAQTLERMMMEQPLRQLYMVLGVPYEAVQALVGALNQLTGAAA
jgi:beta-glucosidase